MKSIKTDIQYRIYQLGEHGGIQLGNWFSAEGYSNYYKNNLIYTLSDAKIHLQELREKGFTWLVVVKVTTSYEMFFTEDSLP